MRGEASRIADRVSRDSLAPKLKATGEDAWRVGNELFAVTDLLDHNIQVERALTDPARPAADKTTMVHTLLGGKAHPMTVEILDDLVYLARSMRITPEQLAELVAEHYNYVSNNADEKAKLAQLLRQRKDARM